MALDIELDTGAQKAAIFSEIVCPVPCKGYNGGNGVKVIAILSRKTRSQALK